MPCANCPGAQVEYDNASGSSYCTECGAVLEENTISAELTFVEGGDGSARMVGQFVSAERSGLRSINMRNKRLNTGQSREETISNARRRFHEVSIALRGLNDYHVDRAVQCYKMALMRGFTQGRKQNYVIAACLYVVCRQEKTVHMLIDFSDVLHTNLYTLGATFLKLIRELDIKLPLIDPSLYLPRFAAKLEFGDKTPQVTNDALRIVQRMRRDWISIGRRPAGLCGAALLIASRMHGFKRTQNEIIRVVKICDQTLRKRLNEFADTPSADLSVEQFRTTDLSEEANPPCFNNSSSSRSVEAEMQSSLEEAELQRWEDTIVAEDIESWSDLSDGEIDMLMLDEEEKEVKTRLWEEMNKDWVVMQELKKERMKNQPVKKKRVNKTSRAKSAESAKEVITQKMAPMISKKINYAALEELL